MAVTVPPLGSVLRLRSMTAAIWTAIALLGATSLGTLFYLGARIDALGTSLGARIDSLAARMDSRFDAVDARLDGLNARLDTHLDRHAS